MGESVSQSTYQSISRLRPEIDWAMHPFCGEKGCAHEAQNLQMPTKAIETQTSVLVTCQPISPRFEATFLPWHLPSACHNPMGSFPISRSHALKSEVSQRVVRVV